MVSKMKGEMSRLQPLISFLLGAAMAAALILFYISADPGRRPVEISTWINASTSAASADQQVDETNMASAKETNLAPPEKDTTPQDLAQLLKNAAMDDGTVIMTSINAAWAAPNSLLDLFLESFREGEEIQHLLDHVLIVAMDPKAFERCRSLHHPHCYFLETRGADYKSEKVYMTKDYLEMMWGRNKFQQTVLELGYNFLFTDVDILWFRNPLRHIAVASHIAISSDFFVGDPDSLANFPNGGFLYVRSCEKTVEFYKNWQLSRDKYPGRHEQNVFNLIKGELSARLKVKIQFLDTAYCSGFCQLAKDLNRVCTVHANCCVGLAGKLRDLRSVLQDWNKYRAGSLAERMMGKFRWTVPGICIH